MDSLPIRRALLSATHKDGLAEFVTFLHANGVELVSTGGTLKFLENVGLPVTVVSDVTGFPEILDGRVKTLHPHIHGGILADKDNPEHLAVLKEKGIKVFDLICANLYDFESALVKGLKPREAIEEIDIGGSCIFCAVSKNFHSIPVLSDPDTYVEATVESKANDMNVPLPSQQRMAARTFTKTSRHDAMITEYLTKNQNELGKEESVSGERPLSSPNLPAWFAPLLPPEILDRREGRVTEIPLDVEEKVKSIGISVLALSRRRALAEKPTGKKDGRWRNACFVF